MSCGIAENEMFGRTVAFNNCSKTETSSGHWAASSLRKQRTREIQHFWNPAVEAVRKENILEPYEKQREANKIENQQKAWAKMPWFVGILKLSGQAGGILECFRTSYVTIEYTTGAMQVP